MASILTWNLWQVSGAMEEVGLLTKELTGEAEKWGALGMKEVVAKAEMLTGGTPGMEEVGKEVWTGQGTVGATGVMTGKGTAGKKTGKMQEGLGRALMRQGIEETVEGKDLAVGMV